MARALALWGPATHLQLKRALSLLAPLLALLAPLALQVPLLAPAVPLHLEMQKARCGLVGWQGCLLCCFPCRHLLELIQASDAMLLALP